MPKIALWISLAGGAGLISAAILAILAFLDPPRGVPAVQAALAFFPHFLGALLALGAAQALTWLAEAAESGSAMRASLAQIEETQAALLRVASAPPPPSLPASLAGLLPRAAYNGWTLTDAAGGGWHAQRHVETRFLADEAQARAFLESLPPPR
jgi:hypothetical protein